MINGSSIKYNGKTIVSYNGGWYQVTTQSETTVNLSDIDSDKVLYENISIDDIYDAEDTLYLWGYQETDEYDSDGTKIYAKFPFEL
jgi:hypothetical protein